MHFFHLVLPKFEMEINPIDNSSESENLEWPELGVDGRYPTLNQTFGMSPTVRPETRSFIDIAAKEQSKVLEIGPAYGIVCLESLKSGATAYWAVDLDERHLKILARKIETDMPQKISCVKLIAGKFPDEDVLRKLDYGSFDAILCEYILHFLTESELKRAVHELTLLLKPGGQLFITVATPYTSYLTADFRRHVEEQLQEFQESMDLMEDLSIPGAVNNIQSVVDKTLVSEEDMKNMGIGDGPAIFLDKCTAIYLIEREYGMEVLSCEYIPMKPTGCPKTFPFQMDGRETVSIVARRKVKQ